MKSHGVPLKAQRSCGRNLWNRWGIRIFFRRYEILESANFPWKTRGNLCFLVVGCVGISLIAAYGTTSTTNDPEFYKRLGILLLVAAFVFFVAFTFVATAPVIGRITIVRRWYLLTVHYVLCRFLESKTWCTGTNKHGYINHLTAHKVLQYGYVDPQTFESVCTMAIVRNPYTRMVSIYLYNRFGNCETFPVFCKRWYKMLHTYRTRGEMEEWHTPCHGIPQFEYTHYNLRQLVQSIVKQEELPELKTSEGRNDLIRRGSTVRDLPRPVLDALLGMPVTNQRTQSGKDAVQPWYDYYDQESLNLTFELYQHDFEVFQYSPKLEQRPDLLSPALFVPSSSSVSMAMGTSLAGGTAVVVQGSGGADVQDLESGANTTIPGSSNSNSIPEVKSGIVAGGDGHCDSIDYDAMTDLAHNTSPPRDATMGAAGSLKSGGGGSVVTVSSSVELMRRNSKERGESEREARMRLLVSSSNTSSRHSSMRQEPVHVNNSNNGGCYNSLNSNASSALSSLASSLSSGFSSSLGRAASSQQQHQQQQSVPPHRDPGGPSSSSSQPPPSPPRLSILVPTKPTIPSSP
jgi:hypothetical protein